MRAVLLSGGLDSAALAVWKRPKVAITVDYGQVPAAAELTSARRIAHDLAIEHCVLQVDCAMLGRGVMTGAPPDSAASTPEWWPFRNQLLITLAVMKLVGTGVTELMLGTVRSDRRHADGRKRFYSAINRLLQAQEYQPRITAPAMGMTSEALVRASGVARSLAGWTHSCQVSVIACGGCSACLKRQRVLEAVYRSEHLRASPASVS